MFSLKKKIRLDDAVLSLYPHLESKTYAQSLIMQGRVRVNDQVITKAGYQVKEHEVIILDEQKKEYVCRAGYKLAHAIDAFNISVADFAALDAGLSTGGFTDCLLQRGARHVYGVDVGYGQVAMKIRQNPSVTVMERTNLRYVKDLPELVDIVTLDLSFISTLKVMETVHALSKEKSHLIVLIKPQFEAEKHEVGKGGIIRDAAVHERIIEKVRGGIVARGYICKGIIDSPLLGTMGNKEFLGYFVKI